MVNVAVVGMGWWGPNLVRNFQSLADARVSVLCDLDQPRAEAMRQRFCPEARLVADYRALAAAPDVDAVAIATPIITHHRIGMAMLRAGKHVFMEKPLAQTVAECRELIAAAEAGGRTLMVGHVFEYNNAVERVKAYLDHEDLGRLLYIYSQRLNLGRIQSDVNAMWSFAPHDISIVNYWLGAEPLRVAARGFRCLHNGVEDVVFVTLEYPGDLGVHLHLGWLDPRKIRQMTLVGSRKMLVYDDVSAESKIQVYDKGVSGLDEFLRSPESFAEFKFRTRFGDLVIPPLPFAEPLHTECQHFVDCIREGRRPRTDGWNGLRIVRALEAAQQSLNNAGRWVNLPPLEENATTPTPALASVTG